jgi:Fur family ferric uptake transcriptional regulator
MFYVLNTGTYFFVKFYFATQLHKIDQDHTIMITDKLLERAAYRLQLKHIRPTHVRKYILSLFLEADHALTHANIEQEICRKFDRVTIYRTLNTFVEHGIIHKILDEDGITRFAVKLKATDQYHRDDHLHFKCHTCGYIFCLSDFNVNDVDMPKNFKFDKLVMSAEGTCSHCLSDKN